MAFGLTLNMFFKDVDFIFEISGQNCVHPYRLFKAHLLVCMGAVEDPAVEDFCELQKQEWSEN